MALLIEKMSPPLQKVKKNERIEFKICVKAGNGSRAVVTHQIFFINAMIILKETSILRFKEKVEIIIKLKIIYFLNLCRILYIFRLVFMLSNLKEKQNFLPASSLVREASKVSSNFLENLLQIVDSPFVLIYEK